MLRFGQSFNNPGSNHSIMHLQDVREILLVRRFIQVGSDVASKRCGVAR